ncbi:hypothetical protein TNIN_97521 [Trichonephila inaurata madagascariensis]|uniref:Uncharacterized protein n=1 Tax=Trichonephila inaurata madagascariensis TaxID=2747483 RepID=A0A8X7BYM1_9ARAC|nr:hypothetical protein TNIN_97521 [Trichonephila inaurata madagascariensis]
MRILTVSALAHDQWIQGPLWLNQPMNEMSSYKILETFSFPDNALKEKKSVVATVSRSGSDFNALTPAHFSWRSYSSVSRTISALKVCSSFLKDGTWIQRLRHQYFWNHWSTEYLQTSNLGPSGGENQTKS